MQRPSPRFRSEEYFVYEISEEMFYPNLQRFVWRSHAGAHLDGLQHCGRKPTETSVTEFCYKSVNFFFEELINIKGILFIIHELFGQQHSLTNVFFKQRCQLSWPSCKCRVTQNLRNSSILYHKTKNPFEAKICTKISFQLL